MSKDIDDYRKQQEIRQAAELRAKLDMVETLVKSPYGRQPKKIGTMICDAGFKEGYREATVSFILRLDDRKGEFYAEHGDTYYVSKSRDALKAKMDQVARVTIDLKWNRYLKVEYKAEIPYRDNWHSTTNVAVDEDRDGKPILGINLTWEVVEFSDPIRLPGDEEDRWMSRDVDEDGNASSKQERCTELPAGLVPYTKEREELLMSIRDAFTSIDKKMCELLKGTPEQVAKRLDKAQGTLLLAAPPKKAKKS